MFIPLCAPATLPAFILADAGDAPDGFGAFWKSVAYMAGAIFFVVSGALKVRDLFGRKPPISDEMKRVEADITKQLTEIDRRRSVGVANAHSEIDRNAALLRTEMSQQHDRLIAAINNAADALTAKVETLERTTGTLAQTLAGHTEARLQNGEMLRTLQEGFHTMTGQIGEIFGMISSLPGCHPPPRNRR